MRELSLLEQEKWYAVAVGEIGIPPTDFYDMTVEEIVWAYKGHRQSQEDLANIILMALLRAQANSNELFEFIDKGYDIGNLKERQDIFTALNIKEES